MRIADFHFDLPPDLIAQSPEQSRDQSRLLVLHRTEGSLEHRRFKDLTEYLRAGDVLVLNDSKVIPARLRGVNLKTGGGFEVLLLEENAVNDWWSMFRPGKRAQVNTQIEFMGRAGERTPIRAIVSETNDEGHRRLRFEGVKNILNHLDDLGEMPVPPYIKRRSASEVSSDFDRYQTVYASAPGSVAAPTAGLHFTESLLNRARSLGIQICSVTLHVGLGTFAPVKVDDIKDHRLHEERFTVSEETACAVNAAKAERRRVVAVGTTSLRVLESVAAQNDGKVTPGTGRTRIFIHPPYAFRIVDALVTNFHLPSSTLLMLVSAFAAPGGTQGRDMILRAYQEAIRERYRFFSYGDAMFIL